MSIPGTFLHAREALGILAEDEALGITPDFLSALDNEAEEVKKEIEALEGVLPELKVKLDSIWEGNREYEYELVSVFMHRGEFFAPSQSCMVINEQERPAEQVIIGHIKHTFLIIVSCCRAPSMK